MSAAKKGDGTTKPFVEYKKELNASDTRVAEIASAGASGNKRFIPRIFSRFITKFMLLLLEGSTSMHLVKNISKSKFILHLNLIHFRG